MSKKVQGTDVLNLNAVKKVYINNFGVEGTYGTDSNNKRINGKILFDCEDLVVKNTTIADGCTAYNVFEQKGTVKYPVKSAKMEYVTCDDVSLKHNVLNLYNFADNATVLIQDSTFNLDVNNSNIVRFANRANAENVTVHFKNVNWNYETAPNAENADWGWAGLVIFQPWKANEGTEKFATWKFIFENCKYNGVKVTGNNTGEHNQVMYLYNMDGTGSITGPEVVEGLSLEFK